MTRARMIAMRPMLSTVACIARSLPLALLLACCWPAARLQPPPPGPRRSMPPAETADAFVMPDGTRLPYRVWLPRRAALGGGAGAARHERQPRRLGDSRRPSFAAAGIAVFAPGPARLRRHRRRAAIGPATQALVDDARDDGAAAARSAIRTPS